MRIELNGHSGCELSLVKDKGNIYVEKSATNKEYNDRLKAQCEKQKTYKSEVFKGVKVLDSGYKNEMFYFDMEYISGITLAEYMRDISLSEIDDLSEALIHCSKEQEIYDKQAKSIFLKKINELEKRLDLSNKEIKEAVEILEKYHWNYVLHSECHGDFTLENMIIANSNIYLIDFLDSFYDSWQIDYAKILQDIELYWHYRNEKKINVNLALRLLILKEDLTSKVLMMNDGEKMLDTIYHILLLNVLRIFPYTKDEKTWNFLIEKLNYVKKCINEKTWLHTI